MKLTLLKILYRDNPPKTLSELIGDCDRLFPHWLISKTEAQKLLAELQKPLERELFLVNRGGENSRSSSTEASRYRPTSRALVGN